jgi:hypothetical protein
MRVIQLFGNDEKVGRDNCSMDTATPLKRPTHERSYLLQI